MLGFVKCRASLAFPEGLSTTSFESSKCPHECVLLIRHQHIRRQTLSCSNSATPKLHLVGVALGQRGLLRVLVSALPTMQWHNAVLLYVKWLDLSCSDMLCIAGLGLLARACLLLRLEDARAGLLYSQYHGILAACTAEHEM